MKTVKKEIKDKHMRRVQNQIMKDIDQKLAMPHIKILPKEHAAIMRDTLRKQFPDIIWKVTCRLGTVVVRTEQKLEEKIHLQAHRIIDALNGYSVDLLDNYYNTGFEYKGKRYRGALLCKLVC